MDKKSFFTFMAVIAWFVVMAVSAVMCNNDYAQAPEPVDTTVSIIQIPAMEPVILTDTAGLKYVIYQ